MRAILLGAIALAVLAQPATAATFVVDSRADTADADQGVPACVDLRHHCTLRAAIMQANYTAGPDVISLPAGTFKLTRPGNMDDAAVLGDLDITDSVTITGRGSAKTIIDGNGSVTLDRVFQVLTSATTTTFAGLTIRNGRKDASAFDEGGGLYWEGSGSHLTLRDVVVQGNRAKYGGGLGLVSSSSGDIIDLDGVVLRADVAEAAGGGLAADLHDAAGFTLRRSRVDGNTGYEGGGISLQSSETLPGYSSASIDSTVIDGNHASLNAGLEDRGTVPLALHDDTLANNIASIDGGAIGNYGVLTADRSTISGNTATKGAGVYTYEGGHTSLTNSTISGNAAGQYGGGIYEELFIHGLASVALTNATVAGNTAGTAGGAFYRDTPALDMRMTDTLVAKGARGGNCSDTDIGLVNSAGNLSDDASCGFGPGNGIPDLRLGPLGDHGGATRTQLPGVGSPAVDGGFGVTPPATDQRGVIRPQGTLEDVGGVEVCQQPPVAPVALGPARKVRTRTPTLTWKPAACVETYTAELRRRSRTGHRVQRTVKIHGTSLRTRKLRRHTAYYWRVTAIGDRGTAGSAWHRFRVR